MDAIVIARLLGSGESQYPWLRSANVYEMGPAATNATVKGIQLELTVPVSVNSRTVYFHVEQKKNSDVESNVFTVIRPAKPYRKRKKNRQRRSVSQYLRQPLTFKTVGFSSYNDTFIGHLVVEMRIVPCVFAELQKFRGIYI